MDESSSGEGRSILVVEDPAWEEMVRHAESDYPEECCGALLGKLDGEAGVVKRAVACLNSSQESRSSRFLVEPEELLEVRQRARTAGLELIGFYHSHPDRGAYFSESDIKNCWPRFANIVLSVEHGRVREAKAFRVDEMQRRAEEELLIRATPAQ
jgi:proteasome lid subunit RPN8/RPN11